MDGGLGSRMLALIVNSPAAESAYDPGALHACSFPFPSAVCIGGVAAVGTDYLALR
jgi:hypothetical protein